MVSKDGVSGDETRVEVVKQWSISKNVHDVQSFHGLVSLIGVLFLTSIQ